MNPALIMGLVNLLLHALTAAPHVIDDVRAIVDKHWDHDMVRNAKDGADMLGKLFADVAGSKAPATGDAAPQQLS
jgi:hypothetical protein